MKEKNILLTGGTGMIGSALIARLVAEGNDITLLVRDISRARSRFTGLNSDDRIRYIQVDLSTGVVPDIESRFDYIVHLASTTHPKAYVETPVATIALNVLATKGLLDIAAKNQRCRFMYASSVEVYGQNRGDIDVFDEKYCGYINCNTMRAGYPESKRCGEALCQAYLKQKSLDVVIPRFTRTYGPTMLMSDTKAISQFIKKGIAGEDIVLKSAGNQFYSYEYVADSVAGLLTVLLLGESGEAYNIADVQSDIKLKDLAELIAAESGTKVTFELPDSVEAAGYSKASKARLDGRKLMLLGWKPHYNIQSGIKRTLRILKESHSDLSPEL